MTALDTQCVRQQGLDSRKIILKARLESEHPYTYLRMQCLLLI